MFHVKQFDVIVIGGGHAGTEAAAAAARMGSSVGLVTLDPAKIGVMSCNPAIGGLGKGHLVREVDALDGIIGRAGDAAGIQFRLLNRSKGPAVQGPRVQADRSLFRAAVQDLLGKLSGLTIIRGEVVDLVERDNRISGVVLADGTSLGARAVVLTAGTFLNGVIHIGDVSRPAGRVGDAASEKLAARLAALDLPRGRLKTGTPPRLDGRTIDWGRLERQPGDEDPVMLSFLSSGPVVPQVVCGITHTNGRTHDIVRANLGRSAMYGGRIEGVGPRYCPSIEDKVVRFADKESHQVFLEPEGLHDDTVYPNGLSTSLPADVQEAYVRSIRGLEQVRLTAPGYAVEYDYVDPRALDRSLAVRGIEGLYFAGQVNGTTGYEEAAAQGVVAGANAARHARGEAPIVLSRTESYIGVMIDDLTVRGVTEPYRMFTSRAEYRLTLRADNADQRLTPMGAAVGLVGAARLAAFDKKIATLEKARRVLSARRFSPQILASAGIPVSADGRSRNLLECLGFAAVSQETLAVLEPEAAAIPPEAVSQLRREALYATFVERQASSAAAIRRDEGQALPEDMDFGSIAGLSEELRGKLMRIRPANLAQAARIEGMTPAALLLLLTRARRENAQRARA